jgi:hypothetical protein
MFLSIILLDNHSSLYIYVVTARLNLPYIVRYGPYRPYDFVPGDASSLLSLTPQNTDDKLASALLIRPATTPSPADVRYYNPPP